MGKPRGNLFSAGQLKAIGPKGRKRLAKEHAKHLKSPAVRAILKRRLTPTFNRLYKAAR
jgi:hypothetical protein